MCPLLCLFPLQVCRNPVPRDCISTRSLDTCVFEAFIHDHPDKQIPFPVLDEFQLHQALAQPPTTRAIVLLENITMTLVSSLPPTEPLSQTPSSSSAGALPRITSDLTILSDPRGPRHYLDCGLLSDRVVVAVGVALRFDHVILVNCSSFRALSYFKMEPGARAVLNDSVIYPVSRQSSFGKAACQNVQVCG